MSTLKFHFLLQIWNDFINSSEDEQNQILKKAERKMSRRNDENGNKEEVTDADEDWEEIIDKRSCRTYKYVSVI